MSETTWRFKDESGAERELSTIGLKNAIAEGTVPATTLVWRDGMTTPEAASSVAELSSGNGSKKMGATTTLIGLDAVSEADAANPPAGIATPLPAAGRPAEAPAHPPVPKPISLVPPSAARTSSPPQAASTSVSPLAATPPPLAAAPVRELAPLDEDSSMDEPTTVEPLKPGATAKPDHGPVVEALSSTAAWGAAKPEVIAASQAASVPKLGATPMGGDGRKKSVTQEITVAGISPATIAASAPGQSAAGPASAKKPAMPPLIAPESKRTSTFIGLPAPRQAIAAAQSQAAAAAAQPVNAPKHPSRPPPPLPARANTQKGVGASPSKAPPPPPPKRATIPPKLPPRAQSGTSQQVPVAPQRIAPPPPRPMTDPVSVSQSHLIPLGADPVGAYGASAGGGLSSDDISAILANEGAAPAQPVGSRSRPPPPPRRQSSPPTATTPLPPGTTPHAATQQIPPPSESRPALLGARELLAALDPKADESTITLSRNVGEIVKASREKQPLVKPKKKQSTLVMEPAPATVASPTAGTNGAPTNGSAPPIVAAPGSHPINADQTTEPLLPAVDPKTEDLPPPSALVRQRTLEMSVNEHDEAAKSIPIPPTSGIPGALSEKHPLERTLEAKKDRSPSSMPPSGVAISRADSRPPSRPPMPSQPPGDRSSRSSFTTEADEFGIKRKRDAIEVPRRSIVTASVLWMAGLVTFFFVGRWAGVKKAEQLLDLHDGLAKGFLTWTPTHSDPATNPTGGGPTGSWGKQTASSEPKPCWVSRQPTKWAPKASKSIPIDMKAYGASMSIGYAVNENESVGLALDPKTGKFEEKFRKKAEKGKEVARISPLSSADGGFFVGEKGDRDVVSVDGAAPFFLSFTKDSVGQSTDINKDPSDLWKLPGDGDVAAEQVVDGGPKGFFLSLRKGSTVYGGYFSKALATAGELTAIPSSGGKAKVGKPRSAFNGEDIATVFADTPEGTDKWQVWFGHAPFGKVADASAELALPEGGPGGDKIAPDIVGLADGRWLVMWTEGASGERAIRALTYTKDFQPIGDPIALSPPAGNFGQALLGPVTDYTTVVFLQAGDDGFELWGAVLRCG